MVASISTTRVTPASHMAETGDTAPPNPVLSVRFDLVTLGVATLVRPDGCLVLDRSKQLALLTYLHAAPRRSARREQLCALLWGDSPPHAAGRAFRSTLSRMRAAIGEPASESPGPEVTLHAPIVSDRDQFLAAVHSGDLEHATSLYTGPFFPSYSDSGSAQFEEWVDLERARLQEFFVRSADSLVRRHLEQGHYRLAKEVARRVRGLAPDAEAGWRLLLESLIACHDDLGARAEAEGLLRWLSHNEREPEGATAGLLKLVKEGAASSELGPDGGLISELVGREQEFSAVLHAWAQTSGGAPRHLHVRANAGLGKTRLLSEVASRIRALGGCVISVRATPGERDVDYALAAELARALGTGPGAGAVNPASTPVLVHLQPALASRYPGGKPLRAERDLTMQRAQALGELLSAIAEDTPVALLVDDLHWADRESRRILSSLSERLGRNRVLLITAGRPADLDLPSTATILPLPPLSVADTEALLASAGTPPSQEWSDRLARALHQASRGSPLLVLETLLLARDRGELRLEEGSWSAPDLDRLVAKVESARALETRLLRLDHPARRHLLLLATAGTPLQPEDFRAILGDSSAREAVTLEELERSGYLIRRSGAWDLSHDEVAAAALELAPVEERLAAHVMLGNWFADSDRSDRATLSRAARHLMLGEEEGRIAPLFRRWVKQARVDGDRTPVSTQARALLGDAAPDPLISRLVESLPFRLRYPSLRPVAAGIAAAAVVVAATLALTRPESAPPPDAEFLLADGSPSEAEVSVYRIPVSRQRWIARDSITLGEGARVGAWRGIPGNFVVSAGGRVAYSRAVQDSGITDLFVREESGEVRRLTSVAGDDVNPSWSPDGKHLAFETARFTPRGNEDSDIAILELATGRVRQVTSGPDYDLAPQWSPDGTRVAFPRKRTSDGTLRICWSTIDGIVNRCVDSLPGSPGYVVGWRDADRLLVAVRHERSEPNLVEVNLSTNQIRAADVPGIAWGSISPDRAWLAVNRRIPEEPAPVSEVFPLAEPWQRRRLVSRSSPDGYRIAWLPDSKSVDPRWSLRIVSPDTGVVGVAHHMAAEAFNGDRAHQDMAQATIHWRSSDTSVAIIDLTTGTLEPRRTGTSWVTASAGGWQVDSLLFHVVERSHRTLITERWADTAMPAWQRFGTPEPKVVLGADGKPAFLNNGDYAFDSGALTRVGFAVHLGLGFETTLTIPIRRPKWQTVRFKFGRLQSVLRDGVEVHGCTFSYPLGEGVDQMGLLGLTALPDANAQMERRDLADGRAHRLRIQIFPDRTCGIAIDGRSIWHSTRPMDGEFPYRLAMFGRTVGAQLLVGPIEIWEGVKPGVDWGVVSGALGVRSRARTAASSARGTRSDST